ncbi:MAG: zinc ribbon domain-containing protein [Pirellulales bacterium]
MPESTRPEITRTEPTSHDQTHAPAGVPCPACGAPVDTSTHFCNACGTRLDERPVETAELVQRHFRCENCGSELATDPEQRSFVCPFCDSTYVVEYSPEATGRQRPEFVIGFAVTPEEAKEKFRRWIADNTWFRPGDLHSAKVEQKLKGIYLPFWSFTMLARSSWSASIGEYWYRTETYTTTVNGKTVTRTRQVRETEWWPLRGLHHNYYSGYLVSGSRGLPQGQADRIKPFYLAALSRYEPYYLAGWLSEEYSVVREDALAVCRQEFCRWEQENIAQFLPGDTYSNLAVSSEFSRESSDLVLLPIYLLSYRYRDKLYQFLVNGQTGRIAGDKPVSRVRIAVAVGIGVALVALVGLVVIFASG